jgi:hypothetical protein
MVTRLRWAAEKSFMVMDLIIDIACETGFRKQHSNECVKPEK